MDFRGDPASALLEVLDPEQNSAFSDHYLEVPFDLSRVLFITTANLVDPIPPALLDRMEVLRLPGYTQQEKKQIARRYLIPRQLAANGLTPALLRFHADALDRIIRLYTSEAGVRNLEREIGTVCRKFARRLVEGKARREECTQVRGQDLKGYLGPQKLFPDTATRRPEIGVATGLAWTAAGGEILQVEVTAVPGKGNVMLTGSLGDVMKESAHIAFSLVRSRHAEIGFAPDRLATLDIHVHVPAGATPKDGPSAGLAMAAAMASLFSGRSLLPQAAMTGEISLRGRVLPVGGVKEKVLAAARAGVRRVILPEKNRHDLDEVPEEIRRKLEFEFVEEAMPALGLVLTPAPTSAPPVVPAGPALQTTEGTQAG
jgi:ATP-dependent Lon protease